MTEAQVEAHNAAIRPQLELKTRLHITAVLKGDPATFYVEVVDKIDPDELARALHGFYANPGPQQCNNLAKLLYTEAGKAIDAYVRLKWEPQNRNGDYLPGVVS